MYGSAFNPAMHALASVASTIRKDRHAVPDDAPLKDAEAKMFDTVRETLTNGRIARDAALEGLFEQMYGSGESSPALMRRNEPAGHLRPRAMEKSS